MNKHANRLALVVVLATLIAFPAGLFGYQAWRTQAASPRVIDILAQSPETGGFSPDHLRLRAGERVRLRISSPDTVHGLSIPGLGVEVNEILPGRPVEVEVTPRQPGRYAFACIRWCGLDHWRMRGVVEVTGEGPAPQSTEQPPLYQQLGLDLDAPRVPAEVIPPGPVSVAVGAALAGRLPHDLQPGAAGRLVTTPVEAFRRLRADPANTALSAGELWALVGWAWTQAGGPAAGAAGSPGGGAGGSTTGEQAQAAADYARDCAACHGTIGKGDGPAGKGLPGLQKMDPAAPAGAADFTDQRRMLAAGDAEIAGKILRGGMGTGMPEFGSLYTDEQLWAMVAYLRSLTFGR